MTASLMPMLASRRKSAAPSRPMKMRAAPRVAILGDGLWRRRYAADSSIVGRQVQVDGAPRTVVGVMPRATSCRARSPADERVVAAERMSPARAPTTLSHNYTLVARLAAARRRPERLQNSRRFAARMTAERPIAIAASASGWCRWPNSPSATFARRCSWSAGERGAAAARRNGANASTLLHRERVKPAGRNAVRTALGATRSRLLSLSAVDRVPDPRVLGGLIGLVLGELDAQAPDPAFGRIAPGVAVDDRSARLLFSFVLGVAIGAVRRDCRIPPGPRLADSLAVSRSTRRQSRGERARINWSSRRWRLRSFCCRPPA